MTNRNKVEKVFFDLVNLDDNKDTAVPFFHSFEVDLDVLKDISVSAISKYVCDNAHDLFFKNSNSLEVVAHSETYIKCGCNISPLEHKVIEIRFRHSEYDTWKVLKLIVMNINFISYDQR